MRDTLFKDKCMERFSFDERVAAVFDDMAHRSIPLYATNLRLMVEWTKRFWKPCTRIYDLGCSTGEFIDVFLSSYSDFCGEIIGIDSSKPMLEQAQQKLKKYDKYIKLLCEDIVNVSIENASVCILNYTLQFVPLENRERVLQKIYAGLLQGGILIISEKVHFAHEKFQTSATDIYELYKQSNGYSIEEILNKKQSLEGVLVTMEYGMLLQTLKNAGFLVYPFLGWQQFVSFIGFKE